MLFLSLVGDVGATFISVTCMLEFVWVAVKLGELILVLLWIEILGMYNFKANILD